MNEIPVLTDIPTWLVEYAKVHIKKNNYDSSHDINHFINVYNYAKQIVENSYSSPGPTLIPGMERCDSLKVLYYSAFSHDLIDGKYVDHDMSIKNLTDLFIENNVNQNLIAIIIFIIDNMSFSKQRLGNLQIPEEYKLVLSIASDADKLDAYRIERVIAYQEHKNKDKYEDLTERNIINRGWLKTILVKRVLMYRDHWLQTDYAKKIAEPMHNEVLEYVNKYLVDVDMFEY